MRRCLLRRQSESVIHGVRALSTTLARCRIKRTDTVGEFKSTEIYVSHMPSLKAKTLGKLTRREVGHPTSSVDRRAPFGVSARRPQAITHGDARGVSVSVPVSPGCERVSAGVTLR